MERLSCDIRDTWLWRYRDAIERGEEVVGLELLTLLDMLIAGLRDDRYAYDVREPRRRMDFMEGCIRLTKSPFYGQPMRLMLWQRAFVEVVYGYKMADTGLDRFREILLLIARKNTKSETSAALANTDMMMGPMGSDIVCASNDDAQAGIIYETIDTMRRLMDPDSLDTWRNQQCIRCFDTGSKIFKMSERMRNKEGRNIDVGYIDEAHEMADGAIVKPIEQSMSLKPSPKMFVLTTEGFVNGGYLDELLARCRRVLSGEDDGPAAERLLPWMYTQDSEEEVWQDPSSWRKSNPTLGTVKRPEYIEMQLDKARRSKADRMYVLAKDFNIKQGNAQAWLSREDYDYPAEFDIEDFRGCVALGAVDLSETTDLTNAKVMLMREGDPVKYVHSHYWMPESKMERADDEGAGARYREWARDGHIDIQEGNEIDLSKVADWFYALYRNLRIRLLVCGYDQKFARPFLSRMDDYGFECEMILQSKYVLSQPMKLCEADFKDRLVNYNRNPVDMWCLGNTAMKLDDRQNAMPVKAGGMDGRRIDGAAALIDLYEVYRRHRVEFSQMVKAV